MVEHYEKTMWNDTDEPLAIFITFRTYGTWLPGDGRGTVNRFHNKYGTKRIREVPEWTDVNRDRMKAEPFVMSARQRACVRKAIRDTCRFRNWQLHAVHIRTNHGHAVVTAQNKKGSIVLNAFKANATRLLRERNLWQSSKSPWSDKGSARYLWNSKSVEIVCNYVEFGQGDELPEF